MYSVATCLQPQNVYKYFACRRYATITCSILLHFYRAIYLPMAFKQVAAACTLIGYYISITGDAYGIILPETKFKFSLPTCRPKAPTRAGRTGGIYYNTEDLPAGQAGFYVNSKCPIQEVRLKAKSE